MYGVGLVARKSPWGPAAVKVEFLNTGVLSRWARDWVPGGGSEVHFRVFHTPGKFLRTDFLRKITKISRELGVGLIELVGQTGALVLNLTPELPRQWSTLFAKSAQTSAVAATPSAP